MICQLYSNGRYGRISTSTLTICTTRTLSFITHKKKSNKFHAVITHSVSHRDRFSIERRKTRTKVITPDNPVNQSKLEVITRS